MKIHMEILQNLERYSEIMYDIIYSKRCGKDVRKYQKMVY